MVLQFGVPLYGGALTGEIVYMENNKLGCNVFEHPLVQTTLPVFLLVERGGKLLNLPEHSLSTISVAPALMAVFK